MLSVRGRSQIQFSKVAGLYACLLLFIGLMVWPSAGFGQYSHYDRYQAAGAPPLNRMVYDRGSEQWGYWSIPGGDQGYEMGDGDPEPLNRQGLRLRGAPRPIDRGGVNYGYTLDDDELPPPPRARRPRRSSPPRSMDIPVDRVDEEAPWAPRTSTPARRVTPPAPTARPDLPDSDAVPSAVSTRRRGETVPSPQSRLEAQCDTCQPTAGGAGATAGRTSRQILNAVDRRSKAHRDAEAAERKDYEEIEDKRSEMKPSREGTNNKFVERLLSYAAVEANRRVRYSRGKRYTKSSLNKGMQLCLQGVRMALQKTTGRSTAYGIGATDAKNAGPFLVRDYGYTKAPASLTNPRNAPDGAIIVYKASDSRKAGHIEIKGNGGFSSDYFSEKPINELMSGRRRVIGIYLPPKA